MTLGSGDIKRWPLVGVASVVDVLEKHGVEGVMLAGALGNGSFVGPAVTVDLAVTDPGSPSPTDQADPSVVWRILDSAPPGSVLVIATHAQRLTVVGGVTAATACGRELAGIVTDGGIRDTDEIREYGIPIRYAFSDPRAMRDRLRVHAVGRPVRFGDVQVAPGDIVVGDADGVVCVPRHLADDVIGRAATIDGQERLWAAASRVLGSIAQGYEATAKVHGVPH